MADGLAALVEKVLEADPFSHTVFLCCNRELRILKEIYSDRTGFALWVKRPEKHQFSWPQAGEHARRETTAEQFERLLSFIGLWHTPGNLQYGKVG